MECVGSLSSAPMVVGWKSDDDVAVVFLEKVNHLFLEKINYLTVDHFLLFLSCIFL